MRYLLREALTRYLHLLLDAHFRHASSFLNCHLPSPAPPSESETSSCLSSPSSILPLESTFLVAHRVVEGLLRAHHLCSLASVTGLLFPWRAQVPIYFSASTSIVLTLFRFHLHPRHAKVLLFPLLRSRRMAVGTTPFFCG
ncbi:hypothetical protein MPH_03292 [Macrophomina phaseolina MS6]|uniref:Uncharacterized protein n=1 Tax=Macrophomina phaseolina (strain MS6) TaxID=1126212 RepID=K2SAL0_MACPH|nr:hypothetical protein MPH_03292 [Macrophomina phaseolina MS6]